MRAAVQQSTGTRAVRRILGGCACVCDLMSVGSALGVKKQEYGRPCPSLSSLGLYIYISPSKQSLKPNSNRNNKKSLCHDTTPFTQPRPIYPQLPTHTGLIPNLLAPLPSPALPSRVQPTQPSRSTQCTQTPFTSPTARLRRVPNKAAASPGVDSRACTPSHWPAPLGRRRRGGRTAPLRHKRDPGD
jgi:hypothetical protein